jgi:hypothetical protein
MKKNLSFTALALIANLGYANTLTEVKPFDSVTAYFGQGANHNFKKIPGAVLTGDVDWEKSYFASIGLIKNLGTLEQHALFTRGTWLAPVKQGVEVVLTNHHGLQSNSEIGAAYKLTTPDLSIGPLQMNFGTGLGISHAVGNPTYEDGPKDDPERRYRTQLLILLDIEWRIRSLKNLSIVTRVHHRSGAYGLIAPRNVGSNFLTVGMRYTF